MSHSELAGALDRLQSVARAANVDSAAANDEAAALVAAICAAQQGAPDAWAKAFAARSNEFATAGARGAAWRDRPTPVLAQLVADGSGAAPDYAAALSDVALAASDLVEASMTVLAAASVFAAAQRRCVARSTQAVDVAEVAEVATAPPGEPSTKVDTPAESLDALLAELDALVGLTRVKTEVREQAELLRITRMRAGKGLKTPEINRHMVFVGNPGTGKSTVARLVSRIYRALELLDKGQLVETDRAGLVAGYLGQTAQRTSDVIGTALGGVLFIDEAYSLLGDQYAAEAIATLVKAMEDHREELVVIVAGYPTPMEAFIDQNPGLSSRFRLTITFDDYSDDELVTIFESLCTAADFAPTAECVGALRQRLLVTPRGEGFGNARAVRNIFEEAVVNQAWRLRDLPAPSVDQLRELLADDVAEQHH